MGTRTHKGLISLFLLPFMECMTGIIHLTGIGAASLFIGIPTRHIHSHNGEVDLNDIEQAIKLLVETIKELDEKTVNSFTDLQ